MLVSSFVFESGVAVPGVQAHSVQRTNSVWDHPSEGSTGSHGRVPPGPVVQKEDVAVAVEVEGEGEGEGVVHLPLIRRATASGTPRASSDRSSTWDAKSESEGRIAWKRKDGGRARSASTALRDVQDMYVVLFGFAFFDYCTFSSSLTLALVARTTSSSRLAISRRLSS